MNAERLDLLRGRSAAELNAALAPNKIDAREIIRAEAAKMVAAGEALELSDEEERMLNAFRRFKLRMRKNGEVFKWQTRIPDGIEVVAETGNIAHPNEEPL
jgi:hypothetical protein